MTSLVERHVAFAEALREAGLPVSLAEGLDAARAVTAIDLGDREALRAAYAATLVKRDSHRPVFDRVFELFFPALLGDGTVRHGEHAPDTGKDVVGAGPSDSPAALADFRERLAEALPGADEQRLGALAREAVQRFGRIQGRGEGEQRWSAYDAMKRVAPDELVHRILAGLDDPGDDTRRVEQQARAFERLVDADVSRRLAEARGPAYAARHTVRLSVDRIDFTAARRSELAEMRRQVQPLARKLSTRASRERRGRRRGGLDFRRTIRESMSTGGVPLTTYHRPRHPGRTDLAVLCDVSGSVAGFAGFTLMLVFALREQFDRVRAFTFVDDVVEVTDRFEVGADPGETLAALAASAEHASRWGRTAYGRAFTSFREQYGDVLTPRTNLLVLGDARSNHSDLALPVVGELVHEARHSWWLNPEHRRHWGTGDSAAGEYAALMPMVECRNLAQLGEFVHSLP
ncbi:MAG: VWA domain-containing protein [Marmoricola sp.]